MNEKKEVNENEKRVESAIAGEGAHVDELQVNEKDRQESVAGNVKETKPAKSSNEK